MRSVTGTSEPVTTTVIIWARGATTDGVAPQMALVVNGTERATWAVPAGDSYSPYSTETPLTGQDVFEV